MKAFVRTTYGGPEILRLEEVEKPKVKPGHVLVKVATNSANPADWHILRGAPFFARFTTGLFQPTEKILGADFAGVVEAVGPDVAHFAVGDQIIGSSLLGGAFAEFVSVPAKDCGKIPEGLDMVSMACLPIPGLTAFQAIATHGKLHPGETVLINGSSGGVGHLAVQIAKAFGGKVTAVCSERNKEFVLGLGAENVIAYDREDLKQHQTFYDLVIDTHGNLNFNDFKRLGRRGIMVGFTTMGNMVSTLLTSKIKGFPLTLFTASANTKDLETLANLLKKGDLKIHIEKTYPATEIPAAIAYIEAMHTRGKVAMVW